MDERKRNCAGVGLPAADRCIVRRHSRYVVDNADGDRRIQRHRVRSHHRGRDRGVGFPAVPDRVSCVVLHCHSTPLSLDDFLGIDDQRALSDPWWHFQTCRSGQRTRVKAADRIASATVASLATLSVRSQQPSCHPNSAGVDKACP